MEKTSEKKAPIFRTAYGPKIRVALNFNPDHDRTKQSFKAECDINNILARFRKTGTLDFVNRYQARYADVSAHDFTRAQYIIAGAKTMFNDMPAHVRARFDNDPGQFLAFIQDERNIDEARELGLLKPAKPSKVQDGAGGGGADAAAAAAAAAAQAQPPAQKEEAVKK